MRSYLLIVIILLSNCAINKNAQNYKSETCYFAKDGYVYINIYNNTNETIYFENISSIRDNDLKLISQYYAVKSDTLHLRFITEEDISITHINAGTQKSVRNPIVSLKPGELSQQLFKTEESKLYEVIDYNRKVFIESCNDK